MKATLLCISLIIISLVLVTQIGAKVDLETAMGIWLFDENKGAVATDISGNNNHGQIQFAEWVTGKFGKALKFNGLTSRVVIADSESLYAKKAWTITSWVKVDPSIGGMGYILVKGGGNGINYGLRTSGDGMAWDAFFMEGGAWKGAFNKGKVKGGKWVYMTATYDGVNEIRVYENGEVIGSSERGKPPPQDNSEVNIGGMAGQKLSLFRGLLDEVALFSVVLRKDDMRNLMKNGVRRTMLDVAPLNKLATSWGAIKSQ